MQKYKYLIVGGGMTEDSAAGGIREVDPTGSIGIISAESDKPYDRPPLTKSLWKDKKIESIWRDTDKKKVQLHLGRRVNSIDPRGHTVSDDQGDSYSFEKLLIATGGQPRLLSIPGADHIIYYRTVQDYRKLRGLTEQHKHFAVIGGGFIGSELSASLAMNGKEVTLLFPGSAISGRVFPKDLSEFLNEYYRKKGVEILPEESAKALAKRGDNFVLQTSGGREIVVSAVLAGIGIEPNVDLARAAGLKVDDGIVVNEFLQTSAPDIYAAGDCANFFNPALGKRIRVEHEDNANTMGRAAGRNLAGRSEPYHHLPFFYSDLFDLGYEAVGDLDARLETFADWKTPFREGVIYYLQSGRVRGVLLWNVWNQVDAARKVISELGPFRPTDLKGRLG